MYEPETSLTGFGDYVIVLTDTDRGFAFGQYTGNKSDNGESFEIAVEDLLSGEKHTEWIHKEDIYQSTEENLTRVREMTEPKV